MAAKKELTNAMRILDKQKIEYETISYDCKEFIDGLHAVKQMGLPEDVFYKTLVLSGKSKEYYVFVIPVAAEIDLKEGAKVCSEKSVELIPVKDINALTGYIRGGCTPIGMKKRFKTFVDESASNLEKIYISGGRIGSTIGLKPADLLAVTGASYASLITKN